MIDERKMFPKDFLFMPLCDTQKKIFADGV